MCKSHSARLARFWCVYDWCWESFNFRNSWAEKILPSELPRNQQKLNLPLPLISTEFFIASAREKKVHQHLSRSEPTLQRSQSSRSFTTFRTELNIGFFFRNFFFSFRKNFSQERKKFLISLKSLINLLPDSSAETFFLLTISLLDFFPISHQNTIHKFINFFPIFLFGHNFSTSTFSLEINFRWFSFDYHSNIPKQFVRIRTICFQIPFSFFFSFSFLLIS